MDAGKVVIKTEVDNKDFNKGIEYAYKRLEELEKKAHEPIEIDGVKVTGAWNLTEEENKEYEEMSKIISEINQKEMERFSEEQQITQETKKQADALQPQLSDSTQLYVTILSMLDTLNLIENKKIISDTDIAQANDLRKQISETAMEYKKLTGTSLHIKGMDTAKSNFAEITKSVDNVGNGIKKATSKVIKWGLAVFGVRSAYMAIRQAMSTLSQYDKTLASDIEYIRWVLANALKPVIEGIIQLVYKLLAYLGYIAKAWFGINLFANASAKAFKKQKEALGGSVKKAKELQKTMSSFDEMNVVQSNKDTSGGGGGGGVATPSMDLGSIADVPIPEWIKWIAENKDLVIAGLIGIATALTLIKFGVEPLFALGIGIALAGILLLIQDIITFINDPSWENFANILRDLGIILAGVAVAMIAFNATNPVGWIMLAISAVILLVSAIIKYWDEIKAVLGKVWEWVYDNVIEPVANVFRELWEIIKSIFEPVINFFTSIFRTVWSNIKIIFNDIAQIFSFLWDKLKAIFTPVAEFFKSVFTKAFGFIKTVFSPIVNFFADIWTKVSGKLKSFGAKVGEVVSGAFKGVVNGVLGAIENILNSPIKAINGLIKTINKVPGIDLDKLKEFKLPRLAKGGIVNNPGPGVMMGSYIAGERGPEAVIPLDDNTLDRLGLAFARHTTINATLINQMNGRVISRELQKINGENDFAYNR